jgi:hypothetical protein
VASHNLAPSFVADRIPLIFLPDATFARGRNRHQQQQQQQITALTLSIRRSDQKKVSIYSHPLPQKTQIVKVG